jgi:hypothetical protein
VDWRWTGDRHDFQIGFVAPILWRVNFRGSCDFTLSSTVAFGIPVVLSTVMQQFRHGDEVHLAGPEYRHREIQSMRALNCELGMRQPTP